MIKLYLQVATLTQLDIFAGFILLMASAILGYTLINITSKITTCINRYSEAKKLENTTKQKHLTQIENVLEIINKQLEK
ncbi:MAG: hypothetical protein ACPG5B_06725 [Chitinophagales bacterium]